jgi:hypothetical protein
VTQSLDTTGFIDVTFLVTKGYKSNNERRTNVHEQILIEKMEEGYLFYLKNGIIKSVKTPVFGKLTLVYQDGKLCYIEKAETIK